MEHVTIGAAATQTGTPASTIRYYEAIGLLPAPGRINGRRRYDALALQRLNIIHFAQAAGFSLHEIKELFFGFAVGTSVATRWQTLARHKVAELDAQIAQLRAMQALLHEGMQCGCLTIAQCSVMLSGKQATS